MSNLKCIDTLISKFKQRSPIRAGSLIITLFGDSISQHGNCVWLSSLIAALEPLGLNQRQIRTAVFRLVQEEWLSAEQIGRRSYYGFTQSGLRHYEHAANRIYAYKRLSWAGKWTLVLPCFVSNHERDLLRKELHWLGYGTLSSGLFARPSAERAALDQTLEALGIRDKVVIFEASSAELNSSDSLKQLVHKGWNLEEIESRYEHFLKQFKSVLEGLKKTQSLSPEQGFQTRTLLIHEYRRILLNDADLYDELLPKNWLGNSASELSAELYQRVHVQAMEYILTNMQTPEGTMPKAIKPYFNRFGCLA